MTDFQDDNLDIPYEVDEFATPDPEKKTDDVDQPNKSILVEVQAYLKEAITEHNTLDVIDITEQGKMTPTQQVAVHKLVTNHLRNIQTMVNNKVKELK